MTMLGPYILALLALAGTIYSIRSQKAKIGAETEERVATVRANTIEELTDEITRLNLKAASMLLQATDAKSSVKRALELIARLLQGVNILLSQVRIAGLEPDWLPDAELDRLARLCAAETGRLAIPAIQQLIYPKETASQDIKKPMEDKND